MKLTNYEIKNIADALMKPDSLLYSSEKLPIKILWVIDGNLQKLNDIKKRINDKQEEINQEYNNDEKSELTTFENGELGRKVKPEFLKEYQDQINELMLIKNDVDIETLSIDVFENILLSPSEFGSIRFMLEDSKKEEEE